MITEQSFQDILDRDPSDWQTRLILADFLEEQGDPRASGYRAMGVLRKYPAEYFRGTDWLWYAPVKYRPDCPATLSRWWLKELRGGKYVREGMYREYKRRRSADNEAALAFLKLPPDRQKELLGSVGTDN